MSVPYYSIRSGPGEMQRSYVDQLTGQTYPYSKGSSTNDNSKAVAFAALTAGQSARIVSLRSGGFLQTKGLDEYTIEELRAAQAKSVA